MCICGMGRPIPYEYVLVFIHCLQLHRKTITTPPRRNPVGAVPYNIKLLLLAEKAAKLAECIADIVDGQLCLDAVNDGFNLIVGQVYSQQLLNCADGISLELGLQSLVVLDLLYQFFDFLFDIHNEPPDFR